MGQPSVNEPGAVAEWCVFRPRTIAACGVRHVAGWRLKTYEINAPAGGLNWNEFEAGIALAVEGLPQPPVETGRAGLGVLIAHPGAGWRYVVLGWWENENELITRTVVQPMAGGAWRAGGDRHSFCVWDMEVLWFERGAWIETMLNGSPSAESYLARRYSAGE